MDLSNILKHSFSSFSTFNSNLNFKNESLLWVTILSSTTPQFSNEEDAINSDDHDQGIGVRSYIIFFLLTITSLSTIIGNGLVVASIWKDAQLQSPTNYFIASLAVADLLVGGVVIPFEAITELTHRWLFGALWCDLWRAMDVLLATSSILNLCIISLDRYWAITEPFSYPYRMTPLRAFRLIFTVWACSLGISFPAILYWRWTRQAPFPPETCLFTEDPLYLLLSSTISFYLPLVIMLYTYFRIYRAAVRQTRSIQMGAKFIYDKELELKLRMRIHRGGRRISPTNSRMTDRVSYPSISVSPPPKTNNNSNNSESSQMIEMKSLQTTLTCPEDSSRRVSLTPSESGLDGPVTSMKNRGSMVRRKLSKFSKEKKAAKTLAIVLGVFIICWMPFFIMNVVAGLCTGCGVQKWFFFSLVTWLGWINSAINPLIYASRSLIFRKAFVRMLCCNRRVQVVATRAWSTIKR